MCACSMQHALLQAKFEALTKLPEPRTCRYRPAGRCPGHHPHTATAAAVAAWCGGAGDSATATTRAGRGGGPWSGVRTATRQIDG